MFGFEFDLGIGGGGGFRVVATGFMGDCNEAWLYNSSSEVVGDDDNGESSGDPAKGFGVCRGSNACNAESGSTPSG